VGEQIKAPWTQEQVESLNEYQRSGVMHPFTCGHCRRTLTATEAGWICRECALHGREYKQDWCWNWMADGTWRRARL
jgi:hypothetical protein